MLNNERMDNKGKLTRCRAIGRNVRGTQSMAITVCFCVRCFSEKQSGSRGAPLIEYTASIQFQIPFFGLQTVLIVYSVFLLLLSQSNSNAAMSGIAIIGH